MKIISYIFYIIVLAVFLHMVTLILFSRIPNGIVIYFNRIWNLFGKVISQLVVYNCSHFISQWITRSLMIQSCCSIHGRADFTVMEKRQGERLVSWIVNVTGFITGKDAESLVAKSEYIAAAKRSSASLRRISRPGNISLQHWIGDYSPVLTILESCSRAWGDSSLV